MTAGPAGGAMGPPAPGAAKGLARRAYIDWMRGLAVVVMILWHAMDAWTRREDRALRAFDVAMKIGGMAAPLFLFLAGLSVALAAGAKARKSGDDAVAAAALRRRGWEIFGLALLFRLQAFLVSPGASLAGMLKVDILNVMGPAMVGAAAVWGLASRTWLRVTLLGAAACAFALLTPPVRAAGWVAWLPDPLEWYLRPPAGRSWFTLFPWAGLLFAGAVAGVLLDRARDEASERRANAGLLAGGAALFAAAYLGSYLPPLHPRSAFWTTSLSYFFLRIGLMTLMLGASYFVLRRFAPSPGNGMLEFGHSSLFVYWVHVEMAYGMLSYPLHRALPIAWAFAAYLGFTLFLLWLSRTKTRKVAEWKARTRQTAAGPAPA